MILKHMHKASRKARRGRRGQIITVAALFFPILLAFMGLSLDAGLLFHTKRRMQAAADAGAMGGARELWRGNNALVTSAAKNDTGLNSFNDKNATITVNNPPASGPHAGDAGFVEVIISQPVPTYFMRIINQQSETVKARAVAGIVTAADGCVLALDPSMRGALTVQGTSILNADCGVMVDSNDTRAIVANGGACIYGGPNGIGVSGDYVANGSANCLYPSPAVDVPRAMDPLAYMTPPAVPVSPVFSDTKITGGVAILSPGQYDNGITITGGVVTFLPGVYILNGGGLQISGSPVVTGLGVMFYNTSVSGGKGKGTWGTFNINGTATVNFKAPFTGSYAGVLFWDDKNAPNLPPGNVINGNSLSGFEGALYMPSTSLTYSGTSDTSNWTMLIADAITVSGNATVSSNYSLSPVPVPTRKSTLVE